MGLWLICSELFKQLKSKCNKEDIRNLHLTSNRMKLFRTKNQREESVRRFVEVLSSSENLMSQSEVDVFLKKNAFHIHWLGDMSESDEDMEEISGSECPVCFQLAEGVLQL